MDRESVELTNDCTELNAEIDIVKMTNDADTKTAVRTNAPANAKRIVSAAVTSSANSVATMA